MGYQHFMHRLDQFKRSPLGRKWGTFLVFTFLITFNQNCTQVGVPIGSAVTSSSTGAKNSGTPRPTPGGGQTPSSTATPAATATPTATSTPSPTPTATPISGGTTLPPGADYFPAGNLWTQDISDPAAHPKDTDSDSVIANLQAHGGWGTGAIRIDTSINVLVADASTPKLPVSGDFSPDGDNITSIPAPTNGSLEAESGYQCTGGGDCHLIVWDQSVNKLYEGWSVNYNGSAFTAGIFVLWDLNKNYPSGRGDGCSSADAAGFPIAPLLFSADEVASGEIKHAFRYILPNDRWRDSQWIYPATHTGGLRNGNTGGLLYGSRLRLKASKNISGLSATAQVVARAMKKYGIFAADGGNIALTAMSDKYTTHKWSEFPQPADARFAPIDLSSLQVSDFEIVNDGRKIGTGDDCVRNGM